MKKWIERILLPIYLISGYGLMALVYLAVAWMIGYLLAELVFRTLMEPSVGIMVVDVVTVGLLVFLLTRKRVRTAFSELWKQITRNM